MWRLFDDLWHSKNLNGPELKEAEDPERWVKSIQGHIYEKGYCKFTRDTVFKMDNFLMRAT